MRLVCKYSNHAETHLTIGKQYYTSDIGWFDKNALVYITKTDSNDYGCTLLKSRFIAVSVRLYYEKL